MLTSKPQMRKVLFLVSCLMAFNCIHSQKKDFDYDFYGFVRGDVYYNSRSNVEVVDGLFYLYPKDVLHDANGKDINGLPSSGFFSLATRVGLNMRGPAIGAAKSSAKVETDFGGTGGIVFMLRLRQAYLKLDWDGGSSLLLGQTWHPLFGEVVPDVVNLSTGAPFQPFNRSPQVAYQLNKGNIRLKANAVYQLIYMSDGPGGKSQSYLKNGVIPEIYIGADYRKEGLTVGAGVNMLSLKPRLQSEMGDKLYRVNERITSFSYDLHAGYTHNKLKLSAKTLLASNLGHTMLLGGYGVSNIAPITGEQEYTPFRHSTSWLNIVYGKRYQGGLLAGYTKNLGTTKELVSGNAYGMGLDVDRITHLSLSMKYNRPHWTLGFEYTFATAWYGDLRPSDGKVINTNDVSNNRIESVFIYHF